MLESTVNTDLLSVMAKTYLNFTQVVAENGRFSQHFFYGENFPADLTAAHVTLGTTSPPDLARNILLNLGAQTTQPTWCLTQIPEGYVFVMHSSAEPRTLLEWLPTSEGNALRAEALQQDRFVQTSSLFAVS